MLNTARATHAIAFAPHHLASQSALSVMRDGGNAIEVMVAAAATIAVVYPHMHGIGGDSFWIIVPRWLLGCTWGQSSDTLKLEQRFPPAVVDALVARCHEVEVLLPFDETMGHAGALVRHADGMLEGASDPRSDGGVAAY